MHQGRNQRVNVGASDGVIEKGSDHQAQRNVELFCRSEDAWKNFKAIHFNRQIVNSCLRCRSAQHGAGE